MESEIILKKEPFMTFYKKDKDVIGIFDYKDGEWFFDGDMEESAKLFIDMVIKNLPNTPENLGGTNYVGRYEQSDYSRKVD